MTYRYTAAALIACSLTGVADARPVSYPGGWTVMQQANGDFASLHVHYSPTFRDSIGIYAESNWFVDTRFVGVQYNRLVHRWNAPRSQANLYIKAGLGRAERFDGEGAELGSFLGVAADWETRRWFASYEVSARDYGEEDFARQSARFGVAPYIGDYGDLHTWLMVQVENQPEADEPLVLTGLVRFFYGTQLLEIGYTPETEAIMLNTIYRF